MRTKTGYRASLRKRIRVKNGWLSLATVMGLDVPEMRICAVGVMRVNLAMASRAPHGFHLMPHRFGIRDGDPLTTLFDLAFRHHGRGDYAPLSTASTGGSLLHDRQQPRNLYHRPRRRAASGRDAEPSTTSPPAPAPRVVGDGVSEAQCMSRR